MGVEYRHFLAVDDASWKPETDTAARVQQVLHKWRIATELENAVDLSNGINTGIEGDASSITPGAGVAFIYRGVEGRPVATLAGPSKFEAGEDARYTMATSLVLGDDYRVQWSSEGIYFELVAPPRIDGRAVPVIDEPYETLFAEAFSSDGASTPPVVRPQIDARSQRHVAWQRCNGFWRGAVIIDFGKDLPAFADGLHQLPSKDFVEELSAAFRGPLVEIGEFY